MTELASQGVESVSEELSPELREYLDEEYFRKLDNLDAENPKLLVVFAGGNAVGKSSLSEKISRELQGLRLENDGVRRMIVKKHPELARTQRLNRLMWQYMTGLYPRLDDVTSNGLIVRDAIVTGSYEKILPTFEAHDYELFVVGYDLSDEKIQELIEKRGDTDITTVQRMTNQKAFHKSNRERFFKEYAADIMLNDETVFDHGMVVGAICERLEKMKEDV